MSMHRLSGASSHSTGAPGLIARRPSCFGGVVSRVLVPQLPAYRYGLRISAYLSATDNDLCSLAGRWYDFICDSIGWL